MEANLNIAMLLKKYKRFQDRMFVRSVFKKHEDLEDLCDKCYFNWPRHCSINTCRKANFGGLLFSQEYRYAYVVKEM